MSLIQTATYPSRGFARIGKSTDHLTMFAKKHCESQLKEVYEMEEDSAGNIWMRSKERRSGRPMDYLEELATIDASSKSNASWINRVDSYYDSKSDAHSDTQLAIQIQSGLSGKSLHEQIYQSTIALMLVHSKYREDFLKHRYFPWYFGLFPSGRILALKCNPNYEARLTALRWGNLLSIYDASEINKLKTNNFDAMHTMAELHEIGIINAKPYFQAVSNLFYPYAHSIIVGGFGYIFVLFTDERDMIDRGPYPWSRMDIHKGARLMPGVLPPITGHANAKEGWMGRYVPSKDFPAAELLDLFRGFVAKFNHSLRMRIDLTNYRKKDDAIDFVGAFEEYFTLDRIALELNYCQTATSSFTARSVAFAMLDKFSEIVSIAGIDKTRLFHHFVSKAFKNTVLLGSLRNFPPPFSTFFPSECDRVYDSVHTKILGNDGLWMAYRYQAGQVQTREWNDKSKVFQDRAKPYSEDAFVGEIVRTVRNTHHGYLSDEDKRRRFAVFVSMHTGQISDEFSAIPQLIWLATMENPESTILSGCLTDKFLTTVPA